jgi:hypothetical protein
VTEDEVLAVLKAQAEERHALGQEMVRRLERLAQHGADHGLGQAYEHEDKRSGEEIVAPVLAETGIPSRWASWLQRKVRVLEVPRGNLMDEGHLMDEVGR